MNFKLKELNEVLFERKGWMAIITNLVAQTILTMIFVVPFIIFFAIGISMTADTVDADDFGLGLFAIFFFISLIVLLPLGIYLQAGLYGSLKESIEEGTFSIKSYFKYGLTYFWPVLGYSLLLMVVVVVFAIILALFGGLFGYMTGDSNILLEMMITFPIGLISMLFAPVLYLCVIDGDTFSHVKHLYKKHGKEYVIVSIIFSVLISLPLISVFASMLMLGLIPYVMVLFYDFEDKEEVNQKDKEEVIELSKDTEEKKEEE